MRFFGGFLVFGFALAIASFSTIVAQLACNDAEGCAAASWPVLAAIFAWIGFAGVVVSSAVVRASTVAVLATAAAWVAWLSVCDRRLRGCIQLGAFVPQRRSLF